MDTDLSLLNRTDNAGRLTHFRDSTGEIQEIKYPKGKTYAVCDAVVMIKQRKDIFAVVYGLQTKENLTSDEAASEFADCVMHQSRCNELCGS